MAGTVGTHLVAQVGFIVKDIETTKRKWAAFLGVDVPETQPCGDYEITQTVFMGEPAPKANSLLAFFDVGPGLQIELIQPNEEPSTWRNFLNEHGEGMHHIAFAVEGIEDQLAEAKEAGIRLIDQAPRKGAEGLSIAFLHPKSTFSVLTELCENKNK